LPRAGGRSAQQQEKRKYGEIPASFHPFTAKGIIRHTEPSVKTHPEFVSSPELRLWPRVVQGTRHKYAVKPLHSLDARYAAWVPARY
jgi:hypothetical protein